MDEDMARRFSALPSVEKLLRCESLEPLQDAHGRTAVLDAIRTALSQARAAIRVGDWKVEDTDAYLRARCEASLEARSQPALKPIFNLTGTVLHTNLGRAPLPDSAVRGPDSCAAPCRSD